MEPLPVDAFMARNLSSESPTERLENELAHERSAQALKDAHERDKEGDALALYRRERYARSRTVFLRPYRTSPQA